MKKILVASAVLALTSSMTSVASAQPQTPVAPSAATQESAPRYVVVSRTALTPALRAVTTVVSEPTDATGRQVAVLDLGGRSVSAVLDRLPSRAKGTGGFRSFSTLADAQSFVAQPATAGESLAAAAYSVDQQSVASPMLSQVNHQNIYNTIKHLSTNWPNRYTTTNNARQAAAWIMAQEKSFAGSRTDVTTEYYTGCSNCGGAPVVVHTIKGSDLASENVIIGGHYDSIVSGVSSFSETTRAPGADDNASSQGTMLEALRVLHANNFKPRRTLVFMSFPAEETGLNGSAAAAQWFKNQGKNVYGMLNFDMTNYRAAGESNDFSYVSDHTNSTQNAFLKTLVSSYLPSMRIIANECGYECTDHAPFTNQGYPASSLAEPTLFQKLHTVNDTLASMGDTAEPSKKFAQMAIAYAVELGKSAGGSVPTDPTGPTTPVPGDATPLSNGVPVTGLSGATGTEAFYAITVPAGATNLVIATSGGTGDLDLYTKAGAKPTDTSYDCRPYKSGNDESCTVATPTAGTYYIRLKAYTAYSGVTLKASYTGGSTQPAPTGKVLTNGVPVTVAGATGSETVYTVTIPAGASNLAITTAGGTGDLDMYIGIGYTPTDTKYDCRPYKTGNNESCTETTTTGGTYYVRLKGYSAYSGATLTATWN